MKYFVFGFVILMSFVSCVIALWEHNINLCAAWASAFLGWTSALFANLAKDMK